MRIDSPKIHSAFIIASTVIFFPVAIVLIIIRFAAHARVNHLRSQDYRVVGHAFVTFYALIAFIVLLATLGSPKEEFGNFVAVVIAMGILFVTPAVVFYILAASRKKKMKNLYDIYYRLVTADGVRALSGLAQMTGESEKNVRQDISYMIATGRLPHASLNLAEGTVVMNNRGPGAGQAAGEEQSQASRQAAAASAGGSGSQASRPQPAVQAITCFGCGSSSRIVPGVRQECEFCGNSLFIPG
ncbi:hypothetical protein [Cohnella terricola]|uniref:Uncharacterized protein n=1 Tax=Cohnella terricola TaxID=1289167 RepID=A0A559JJ56_9BACL|nr:hypothetical protein [Cohnella terricola]TVX99910.1 hypothetical protein FPZ45_13375 [Cohnella terricola]